MSNHIITKAQRSRNMSHIHSKNTKPEIVLRKALWQKGIRYRKNYKRLPGKPDIAITSHKIAIFIDGEFWHGYNWKVNKNHIHTHREYWIPKIERNMTRDKIVTEKLQNEGWTVLRFWSKEVLKNTDYCVELILFNMRDD